jgi:hypothetical protein
MDMLLYYTTEIEEPTTVEAPTILRAGMKYVATLFYIFMGVLSCVVQLGMGALTGLIDCAIYKEKQLSWGDA